MYGARVASASAAGESTVAPVRHGSTGVQNATRIGTSAACSSTPTTAFSGCGMAGKQASKPEEWWKGAPDAGPLGVRGWRVVQVGPNSRLWCEDGDLPSGERGTMKVGASEISVSMAPYVTGSVLALRARWVHDTDGVAPFAARRPGDGWRGHVQVVVALEGHPVSVLLTAKGLSSNSLLRDVYGVASAWSRKAYLHTGREWAPCAWSARIGAKPPVAIEGRKGQEWVPWWTELGGKSLSEAYVGHERYAALLAEYRTQRLDEWVAEWAGD